LIFNWCLILQKQIWFYRLKKLKMKGHNLTLWLKQRPFFYYLKTHFQFFCLQILLKFFYSLFCLKIIFFSSNIYFVYISISEFERKHTSIQKIKEKEENVHWQDSINKKEPIFMLKCSSWPKDWYWSAFGISCYRKK